MADIIFLYLIIGFFFYNEVICDLSKLINEEAVTVNAFMFWPNATVPFYINPQHFDHEQALAIMNALSFIAFKTCLKFAPVLGAPEGNQHVMVFENPKGIRKCVISTTGHSVDEPHLITLGYDCMSTPQVDMMIMKALGFPFEHNRAIRDVYIDIQSENIDPSAMELFAKEFKLPLELRSLPYDINSVMHFGDRDFSKNGHRTIIFKDHKTVQDRNGLSSLDVRKIELVYGPECRKRERSEKIELCQSLPGVAIGRNDLTENRKKRAVEDLDTIETEEPNDFHIIRRKRQVTERNLRVNRDITPPPLEQKSFDQELEDLGIKNSVDKAIDEVYKLSGIALQHAKTKHCNKSKPASRQVPLGLKPSHVHDVVWSVVKYTKLTLDKALVNITKFCEPNQSIEEYQRSGCPFLDKSKCKDHKSTKSGSVKYSAQHRLAHATTKPRHLQSNNNHHPEILLLTQGEKSNITNPLSKPNSTLTSDTSNSNITLKASIASKNDSSKPKLAGSVVSRSAADSKTAKSASKANPASVASSAAPSSRRKRQADDLILLSPHAVPQEADPPAVHQLSAASDPAELSNSSISTNTSVAPGNLSEVPVDPSVAPTEHQFRADPSKSQADLSEAPMELSEPSKASEVAQESHADLNTTSNDSVDSLAKKENEILSKVLPDAPKLEPEVKEGNLGKKANKTRRFRRYRKSKKKREHSDHLQSLEDKEKRKEHKKRHRKEKKKDKEPEKNKRKIHKDKGYKELKVGRGPDKKQNRDSNTQESMEEEKVRNNEKERSLEESGEKHLRKKDKKISKKIKSNKERSREKNSSRDKESNESKRDSGEIERKIKRHREKGFGKVSKATTEDNMYFGRDKITSAETRYKQNSPMPRTVKLSKKNKEFYEERTWPNGVVYYSLKDDKNKYDLDDVRYRLAEVNNILKIKTCTRLEEIKEEDTERYEDFLVLDESPDYVTGRVGGSQNFGVVELLRGGQHRQHTAMMVMAMLGFYFEVSRDDRDKYIKVHQRHVRPDKLHHFEKIPDATLDLPYDYKSATHPAWQFWRQTARTGISTVATYKQLDPNGSIMKSLGQNQELLSETDLIKINSVYGVECFKQQLKRKKHKTQTKDHEDGKSETIIEKENEESKEQEKEQKRERKEESKRERKEEEQEKEREKVETEESKEKNEKDSETEEEGHEKEAEADKAIVEPQRQKTFVEISLKDFSVMKKR